MKIAIDIDCTLTNCIDVLIDYINSRVPVNLKIDDIKNYYIEDALPEQFRWIVQAGFRDPEMWTRVQFLPKAADVVERLCAMGHTIYFATSAEPKNMHKKINHLARNLDLDYEYIWRHTINIQDKSLLDVDILIDDCLKHLLAQDRHYYSIVIDYPWNQTTGYIPRFTRAKDWTEIASKIKIIEDLTKENENDMV